MRSVIMLTAGLAFIGSAAFAQDKYTTADIVDFFVDSADMGVSRGLCIGTAQECAQPTEPAKMDMLISFELDSAELTEEAKADLSIFAVALMDERLSVARFVVEGHTDARGSNNYNASLSELRAASVRQFLIENGVDPSRLDAVGFGMDQPRTADAMDAENRRVELRITMQ